MLRNDGANIYFMFLKIIQHRGWINLHLCHHHGYVERADDKSEWIELKDKPHSFHTQRWNILHITVSGKLFVCLYFGAAMMFLKFSSVFCQAVDFPLVGHQPRQQGSGANMRPTGPRWAPYWPHKLYYLGTNTNANWLQNICNDLDQNDRGA